MSIFTVLTGINPLPLLVSHIRVQDVPSGPALTERVALLLRIPAEVPERALHLAIVFGNPGFGAEGVLLHIAGAQLHPHLDQGAREVVARVAGRSHGVGTESRGCPADWTRLSQARHTQTTRRRRWRRTGMSSRWFLRRRARSRERVLMADAGRAPASALRRRRLLTGAWPGHRRTRAPDQTSSMSVERAFEQIRDAEKRRRVSGAPL